jgi:acyl-CoA synthetase
VGLEASAGESVSGAAPEPGRKNPSGTLADRVRQLARSQPDRPAYIVFGSRTIDWAGYDAAADRLAQILLALDRGTDEPVAVWLPDGAAVHIAFQATERAGLVALGLGARSGERELFHLLSLARATTLVSAPEVGGHDAARLVETLRERGVPLRHHVVLEGEGATQDAIRVDGREPDRVDERALEGRALGPQDVFLLNSTSGTTGLPKIVIHDQSRWLAFHRFAVEVGELTHDEVILSAVPAPFGFGLWTAHVTPTLLGVPTVVLPRFDALQTVDALERHRVTMLAAVSTQLSLMLESGGLDRARAWALRRVFTGGEAVPAERARIFEERTGACVLQFYGSNETGAVSATRPGDPPEKRLGTAGRPIPEMQLRLFDASGRDVTESGRGRPGVRGPTLSRGYLGAPEANAELIREDGWFMLGDLVELDADGYLRVVGRTDDIIIRGGKNLSAAAIELGLETHPAIVLAAAIGVTDPLFGERVAAYVALRPGESLDLPRLRAHLESEGVARELWPEGLVVLDELPRNVGGKVAKQALREDAARRFGKAGVLGSLGAPPTMDREPNSASEPDPA